MANYRYFNTKFWSDSYIQDLDIFEKLLFNYFLTNHYTNICGIYEISLKTIVFDTGLDRELVIKALKKFEYDDKMKFLNGWIAIKNFIKHQKKSDNKNDNINKGIKSGLEKAPPKLVDWIKSENAKIVCYNLTPSISKGQNITYKIKYTEDENKSTSYYTPIVTSYNNLNTPYKKKNDTLFTPIVTPNEDSITPYKNHENDKNRVISKENDTLFTPMVTPNEKPITPYKDLNLKQGLKNIVKKKRISKSKRANILTHFNHTCQVCSSKENLEVARIKPDSTDNNDINNFSVFCRKCNGKRNIEKRWSKKQQNNKDEEITPYKSGRPLNYINININKTKQNKEMACLLDIESFSKKNNLDIKSSIFPGLQQRLSNKGFDISFLDFVLSYARKRNPKNLSAYFITCLLSGEDLAERWLENKKSNVPKVKTPRVNTNRDCPVCNKSMIHYKQEYRCKYCDTFYKLKAGKLERQNFGEFKLVKNDLKDISKILKNMKGLN